MKWGETKQYEYPVRQGRSGPTGSIGVAGAAGQTGTAAPASPFAPAPFEPLSLTLPEELRFLMELSF